MAGPTGNVVQETAAPGSKAPAASQPGTADQALGRERSAMGASVLELGICLVLGLTGELKALLKELRKGSS